MLSVYNTLTRAKEAFAPRNPPRVTMYVCGITSYDVCHLGHARAAVNFDLICRYLRAKGYAVRYIRNVTDIDDKIIARAQQENCKAETISQRYIQEMQEDYRDLGILPPDDEPFATSYIPQIIAFIEDLCQRGYAYPTRGGDVCFRVRRFAAYGRLSHKKIDELHSGARVEVDEEKEDPLDFVLWKQSKADEPAWPSPWGPGRPGWHIECSTMIRANLGDSIDIHGGGSDLIFPHHENEIAQSNCLTGQELARYWLHCAPLTVGGQKMSKSLNNFVSIRDLLNEYHPEEIRYFLTLGHYRSPLDWSKDAMDAAAASLRRLYIALNNFAYAEIKKSDGWMELEQGFWDAMDDDFNTPRAFAALFTLATEAQKNNNIQAAQSILKCGQMLGLLAEEPTAFLRRKMKDDETLTQQVQQLIAARQKARAMKDWQRADEIRKQLDGMGIILEDSAQGTQWRTK